MLKHLLLMVILGLAAVLIVGCGGGAGQSATGRARITIQWPAQTSRLIPQAATSIRIGIYKGGERVAYQVANRPAAETPSEVVFGTLPIGELKVTAVAYPDSAGNGTPLAQGDVTIVVTPDNLTEFSLTLSSTIARLTVSPNAGSVRTGQTFQLTATAYNHDGAVVMVAPNSLAWSARNAAGTTASGAVASVDETGLVTAKEPGKAEITVRDTESGLLATAQITVGDTPPVSIAITPTIVTLSAGEVWQFTATVTPDNVGKGVTWMVTEGVAGGTITSDGRYTASTKAGTYHIEATSVADPSKTATATVVVALSLSISPTGATVAPGEARLLTAVIIGGTSSGVQWRVEEGAAGGTLSEVDPTKTDPVRRIYTAPATPGTYHVIATSTEDPSQSAVAVMSVGGAPAAYAFATQWGHLGTGDGAFDHPWGVALDAAGNVYVTDTGNNRVQKFDSAGGFITQWGARGSGLGQFLSPTGITVDPSDNVYVADPWNNRIQRFTSAGASPSARPIPGNAERGDFLRALATDVSGKIYAADAWDARIIKISGSTLTGWGQKGTGNGQFTAPTGVAVDSNGNVFVADTLNHRVQRFTGAGVFLGKWGTLGSAAGEFTEPRGIAVDDAGYVYVIDAQNHRVQKFTNTGAFVTTFGTYGTGNGNLNHPTGVAVAGNGDVYVVDTGNNRIVKWTSL